MFKSLGNIRANPAVGLLFKAFDPAAQPARLRVNGAAEVSAGDGPALPRDFPGGRSLVRPSRIFPNCPRHVPDLGTKALSPRTPPGADKAGGAARRGPARRGAFRRPEGGAAPCGAAPGRLRR